MNVLVSLDLGTIHSGTAFLFEKGADLFAAHECTCITRHRVWDSVCVRKRSRFVYCSQPLRLGISVFIKLNCMLPPLRCIRKTNSASVKSRRSLDHSEPTGVKARPDARTDGRHAYSTYSILDLPDPAIGLINTTLSSNRRGAPGPHGLPLAPTVSCRHFICMPDEGLASLPSEE